MIRIKEGFKGQRLVTLPENLMSDCAADPLIGNLYIRKIGYFPHVKYHYVSKQQGVAYAMLIYCTEGVGWVNIDNQTMMVKSDEYIILPPHTPYAFWADEGHPWTIYWIHFCGRVADAFIPHPVTPYPIGRGLESRIQYRLDLFEEMYQAFSHGYIRDYMTYSSMCLHYFLASFRWVTQYRHIVAVNHQGDELLDRVIYYMNEHLQTQLRLEDVASHFHYSVSHFSMLFKEKTGMSPIRYFLHMKVQKACELIELSNLKLNEVANILGFEEPAYFTRIFTNVMGMTPSQYRRAERPQQANRTTTRRKTSDT